MLDGASSARRPRGVPSPNAPRLAEYAGAGVTWWLESLSHRTPMDELRTQLAKGPPAER